MQLLIRIAFVFVLVLTKMTESHRRVRNKIELQRLLRRRQNLWERSGQYQGDIIPVPISRNVITNTVMYWPNGELPYEISESFTPANRAIIQKSLDYLSDNSCIKTRPRVSTDEGSIFITPEPGHGCSSNIGYLKKRQMVYLDQVLGCVNFGVIVHELLHVLGLWHQQSAHNRDKYLDIIWENVKPGMEHNFDKAQYDTTTSFGYKYDFNSIMHYTAYAFSKNGKATIQPKDKTEGKQMGQRQRLSRIDLAKIKTMYDC